MSRTPKSLALVLGTALLAGCASPAGLRPSLSPRPMRSLGMGRALDGTPRDAASWPAAQWWRGLGDPQLDRLIQTALAHNPGLAEARARARAAAAAAAGADAVRLPTLGAGVSADGLRIPATVVAPPMGGHYATLWRAGLSFSYSFDLWGGQYAGWQAALDQAHATQVETQAARLLVAANVARAYIDFAYAGQSVIILKRNVERSRTVYALVRKRVAAGLDSELQLLDARASLSAASQQLEAARRGRRAAALALAALCGEGPGLADGLEPPAPLRATPLALPSRLPAELLARRPDVIAALWRLRGAAQSVKAARAAFMPNINLAAGLGYASLGAGSLLEYASHYEQFAPAVSLPLFDGGRLRAGLRQQDAGFDAAVAQYDGTLVNALHQVADGVSAIHALDQQLRQQRQARNDTARVWHLAQSQYRAGVISEIDMLQVQQALLAAEQGLARLRADRLSAGLSLVVALGGGYQPTANAPTPATVAEIHP